MHYLLVFLFFLWFTGLAQSSKACANVSITTASSLIHVSCASSPSSCAYPPRSGEVVRKPREEPEGAAEGERRDFSDYMSVKVYVLVDVVVALKAIRFNHSDYNTNGTTDSCGDTDTTPPGNNQSHDKLCCTAGMSGSNCTLNCASNCRCCYSPPNNATSTGSFIGQFLSSNLRRSIIEHNRKKELSPLSVQVNTTSCQVVGCFALLPPFLSTANASINDDEGDVSCPAPTEGGGTHNNNNSITNSSASLSSCSSSPSLCSSSPFHIIDQRSAAPQSDSVQPPLCSFSSYSECADCSSLLTNANTSSTNTNTTNTSSTSCRCVGHEASSWNSSSSCSSYAYSTAQLLFEIIVGVELPNSVYLNHERPPPRVADRRNISTRRYASFHRRMFNGIFSSEVFARTAKALSGINNTATCTFLRQIVPFLINQSEFTVRASAHTTPTQALLSDHDINNRTAEHRVGDCLHNTHTSFSPLLNLFLDAGRTSSSQLFSGGVRDPPTYAMKPSSSTSSSSRQSSSVSQSALAWLLISVIVTGAYVVVSAVVTLLFLIYFVCPLLQSGKPSKKRGSPSYTASHSSSYSSLSSLKETLVAIIHSSLYSNDFEEEKEKEKEEEKLCSGNPNVHHAYNQQEKCLCIADATGDVRAKNSEKSFLVIPPNSPLFLPRPQIGPVELHATSQEVVEPCTQFSLLLVRQTRKLPAHMGVCIAALFGSILVCLLMVVAVLGANYSNTFVRVPGTIMIIRARYWDHAGCGGGAAGRSSLLSSTFSNSSFSFVGGVGNPFPRVFLGVPVNGRCHKATVMNAPLFIPNTASNLSLPLSPFSMSEVFDNDDYNDDYSVAGRSQQPLFIGALPVDDSSLFSVHIALGRTLEECRKGLLNEVAEEGNGPFAAAVVEEGRCYPANPKVTNSEENLGEHTCNDTTSATPTVGVHTVKRKKLMAISDILGSFEVGLIPRASLVEADSSSSSALHGGSSSYDERSITDPWSARFEAHISDLTTALYGPLSLSSPLLPSSYQKTEESSTNAPLSTNANTSSASPSSPSSSLLYVPHPHQALDLEELPVHKLHPCLHYIPHPSCEEGGGPISNNNTVATSAPSNRPPSEDDPMLNQIKTIAIEGEVFFRNNKRFLVSRPLAGQLLLGGSEGGELLSFSSSSSLNAYDTSRIFGGLSTLAPPLALLGEANESIIMNDNNKNTTDAIPWLVERFQEGENSTVPFYYKHLYGSMTSPFIMRDTVKEEEDDGRGEVPYSLLSDGSTLLGHAFAFDGTIEQAVKYYGIRGSELDIGSMGRLMAKQQESSSISSWVDYIFGLGGGAQQGGDDSDRDAEDSLTHKEEEHLAGEPFIADSTAISLTVWVKLGPSSKGFVFAATDNWELQEAYRSPTTNATGGIPSSCGDGTGSNSTTNAVATNANNDTANCSVGVGEQGRESPVGATFHNPILSLAEATLAQGSDAFLGQSPLSAADLRLYYGLYVDGTANDGGSISLIISSQEEDITMHKVALKEGIGLSFSSSSTSTLPPVTEYRWVGGSPRKSTKGCGGKRQSTSSTVSSPPSPPTSPTPRGCSSGGRCGGSLLKDFSLFDDQWHLITIVFDKSMNNQLGASLFIDGHSSSSSSGDSMAATKGEGDWRVCLPSEGILPIRKLSTKRVFKVPKMLSRVPFLTPLISNNTTSNASSASSSSSSIMSTLQQGGAFYIGLLRGSVYDLRVYRGALTAEDIALYVGSPSMRLQLGINVSATRRLGIALSILASLAFLFAIHSLARTLYMELLLQSRSRSQSRGKGKGPHTAEVKSVGTLFAPFTSIVESSDPFHEGGKGQPSSATSKAEENPSNQQPKKEVTPPPPRRHHLIHVHHITREGQSLRNEGAIDDDDYYDYDQLPYCLSFPPPQNTSLCSRIASKLYTASIALVETLLFVDGTLTGTLNKDECGERKGGAEENENEGQDGGEDEDTGVSIMEVVTTGADAIPDQPLSPSAPEALRSGVFKPTNNNSGPIRPAQSTGCAKSGNGAQTSHAIPPNNLFSGSVSVPIAFVDFLTPVLGITQSIGMYLSTMRWPLSFTVNMNWVVTWFNIDLSLVFPLISPLAMPALQLFGSLIALSLLVACFARGRDDWRFVYSGVLRRGLPKAMIGRVLPFYFVGSVPEDDNDVDVIESDAVGLANGTMAADWNADSGVLSAAKARENLYALRAVIEKPSSRSSMVLTERSMSEVAFNSKKEIKRGGSCLSPVTSATKKEDIHHNNTSASRLTEEALVLVEDPLTVRTLMERVVTAVDGGGEDIGFKGLAERDPFDKWTKLSLEQRYRNPTVQLTGTERLTLRCQEYGKERANRLEGGKTEGHDGVRNERSAAEKDHSKKDARRKTSTSHKPPFCCPTHGTHLIEAMPTVHDAVVHRASLSSCHNNKHPTPKSTRNASGHEISPYSCIYADPDAEAWFLLRKAEAEDRALRKPDDTEWVSEGDRGDESSDDDDVPVSEGADTFSNLGRSLIKLLPVHGKSKKRLKDASRSFSGADDDHDTTVKPCPGIAGTFFVCPNDDCRYCLCPGCYRGGLRPKIKSKVLTQLYSLRRYGIGPLLGALVLVGAQAIHLPIAQTCLMVLVCHPSFRCLFPREDGGCYGWDDTSPPSPVYICCAIISGIVFAVVGIGLVVYLFALLIQRRSKVISIVSTEREQYTDDPLSGNEDRRKCARDVAVPETRWQEFLVGDRSFLKALYNSYTFKRMWVQPFSMLFKLFLLFPVVFLRPNTATQLTVISSIETIQVAFWLFSAPFTQKWIAFLSHAAGVHQLAQLCLLAFYQSAIGDLRGPLPTKAITSLLFISSSATNTTSFPLSSVPTATYDTLSPPPSSDVPPLPMVPSMWYGTAMWGLFVGYLGVLFVVVCITVVAPALSALLVPNPVIGAGRRLQQCLVRAEVIKHLYRTMPSRLDDEEAFVEWSREVRRLVPISEHFELTLRWAIDCILPPVDWSSAAVNASAAATKDQEGIMTGLADNAPSNFSDRNQEEHKDDARITSMIEGIRAYAGLNTISPYSLNNEKSNSSTFCSVPQLLSRVHAPDGALAKRGERKRAHIPHSFVALSDKSFLASIDVETELIKSMIDNGNAHSGYGFGLFAKISNFISSYSLFSFLQRHRNEKTEHSSEHISSTNNNTINGKNADAHVHLSSRQMRFDILAEVNPPLAHLERAIRNEERLLSELWHAMSSRSFMEAAMDADVAVATIANGKKESGPPLNDDGMHVCKDINPTAIEKRFAEIIHRMELYDFTAISFADLVLATRLRLDARRRLHVTAMEQRSVSSDTKGGLGMDAGKAANSGPEAAAHSEKGNEGKDSNGEQQQIIVPSTTCSIRKGYLTSLKKSAAAATPCHVEPLSVPMPSFPRLTLNLDANTSFDMIYERIVAKRFDHTFPVARELDERLTGNLFFPCRLNLLRRAARQGHVVLLGQLLDSLEHSASLYLCYKIADGERKWKAAMAASTVANSGQSSYATHTPQQKVAENKVASAHHFSRTEAGSREMLIAEANASSPFVDIPIGKRKGERDEEKGEKDGHTPADLLDRSVGRKERRAVTWVATATTEGVASNATGRPNTKSTEDGGGEGTSCVAVNTLHALASSSSFAPVPYTSPTEVLDNAVAEVETFVRSYFASDKDEDRTPLHYAVEYGHADCVDLLLNRPIRVDVSKSHTCTKKEKVGGDAENKDALACSVAANAIFVVGSVEAVSSNPRKIARGTIHVSGPLSVMHFGCLSGSTVILKALLRALPNNNVAAADNKDNGDNAAKYEVDPIHLACQYGDVEMVKAILDSGKGGGGDLWSRSRGPPSSATTRGGETVFHFAAKNMTGFPSHSLPCRRSKRQLPMPNSNDIVENTTVSRVNEAAVVVVGFMGGKRRRQIRNTAKKKNVRITKGNSAVFEYLMHRTGGNLMEPREDYSIQSLSNAATVATQSGEGINESKKEGVCSSLSFAHDFARALDNMGVSPLHIAARHENESVVALLLQGLYTRIHSVNNNGEEMLSNKKTSATNRKETSGRGHVCACKALVEGVADGSSTKPFLVSPQMAMSLLLHRCVDVTYCACRAVEEGHRSTNETGRENDQPRGDFGLSYSTSIPLPSRLLLMRSASPSSTAGGGGTFVTHSPLHEASEKGSSLVASMLVEAAEALSSCTWMRTEGDEATAQREDSEKDRTRAGTNYASQSSPLPMSLCLSLMTRRDRYQFGPPESPLLLAAGSGHFRVLHLILESMCKGILSDSRGRGREKGGERGKRERLASEEKAQVDALCDFAELLISHKDGYGNSLLGIAAAGGHYFAAKVIVEYAHWCEEGLSRVLLLSQEHETQHKENINELRKAVVIPNSNTDTEKECDATGHANSFKAPSLKNDIGGIIPSILLSKGEQSRTPLHLLFSKDRGRLVSTVGGSHKAMRLRQRTARLLLREAIRYDPSLNEKRRYTYCSGDANGKGKENTDAKKDSSSGRLVGSAEPKAASPSETAGQSQGKGMAWRSKHIDVSSAFAQHPNAVEEEEEEKRLQEEGQNEGEAQEGLTVPSEEGTRGEQLCADERNNEVQSDAHHKAPSAFKGASSPSPSSLIYRLLLSLDGGGNTPLHLAAMNGYLQEGCVEILHAATAAAASFSPSPSHSSASPTLLGVAFPHDTRNTSSLINEEERQKSDKCFVFTLLSKRSEEEGVDAEDGLTPLELAQFRGPTRSDVVSFLTQAQEEARRGIAEDHDHHRDHREHNGYGALNLRGAAMISEALRSEANADTIHTKFCMSHSIDDAVDHTIRPKATSMPPRPLSGPPFLRYPFFSPLSPLPPFSPSVIPHRNTSPHGVADSFYHSVLLGDLSTAMAVVSSICTCTSTLLCDASEPARECGNSLHVKEEDCTCDDDRANVVSCEKMAEARVGAGQAFTHTSQTQHHTCNFTSGHSSASRALGVKALDPAHCGVGVKDGSFSPASTAASPAFSPPVVEGGEQTPTPLGRRGGENQMTAIHLDSPNEQIINRRCCMFIGSTTPSDSPENGRDERDGTSLIVVEERNEANEGKKWDMRANRVPEEETLISFTAKSSVCKITEDLGYSRRGGLGLDNDKTPERERAHYGRARHFAGCPAVCLALESCWTKSLWGMRGGLQIEVNGWRPNNTPQTSRGQEAGPPFLFFFFPLETAVRNGHQNIVRLLLSDLGESLKITHVGHQCNSVPSSDEATTPEAAAPDPSNSPLLHSSMSLSVPSPVLVFINQYYQYHQHRRNCLRPVRSPHPQGQHGQREEEEEGEEEESALRSSSGRCINSRKALELASELQGLIRSRTQSPVVSAAKYGKTSILADLLLGARPKGWDTDSTKSLLHGGELLSYRSLFRELRRVATSRDVTPYAVLREALLTAALRGNALCCRIILIAGAQRNALMNNSNTRREQQQQQQEDVLEKGAPSQGQSQAVDLEEASFPSPQMSTTCTLHHPLHDDGPPIHHNNNNNNKALLFTVAKELLFDARDGKGRSALMLAAIEGHREVVKEILYFLWLCITTFDEDVESSGGKANDDEGPAGVALRLSLGLVAGHIRSFMNATDTFKGRTALHYSAKTEAEMIMGRLSPTSGGSLHHTKREKRKETNNLPIETDTIDCRCCITALMLHFGHCVLAFLVDHSEEPSADRCCDGSTRSRSDVAAAGGLGLESRDAASPPLSSSLPKTGIRSQKAVTQQALSSLSAFLEIDLADSTGVTVSSVIPLFLSSTASASESAEIELQSSDGQCSSPCSSSPFRPRRTSDGTEGKVLFKKVGGGRRDAVGGDQEDTPPDSLLCPTCKLLFLP